MNIVTWDSRAAQENWRGLLDAAAAGQNDVVITRHGRPAVAVIAYEDYLALQDDLDDLRAARHAEEVVAAWRRDPTIACSWTEVEAELVVQGLLDAER